MAKTFLYKAKDRTGHIMDGTILADNQAAVAAYIRDKGYFVTMIKEQKKQASVAAFLQGLSPVNTKDLSIFCRQFATMVDAGLSMIACLNILIEQTYNPTLKKALQDVHKKVQEGETLSMAMQDHSSVFPVLMVSMIEAGELGGVLDIVLNRLATHFEKEHKLNEKVKSAMTYPAVVISMAIMAVTFILTFVLPTFTKMFADMKIELPLPTRILLGISGFIQDYWLPLLIGVGLVGYGAVIAFRHPKAKPYLDQTILQLPVFGLLWRKIAIARFSRTLSTLIHGGVPIISAIDVVKKITANTKMMEALTASQVSIREGLGLATPLGASNVFTPMVIQMVAIGEETGKLDNMLEKVADFYENDVDDIVGRLSSMLEPILIGFLGVVIGLIVISVVMPMFDAVSAVGR